MQHFSLLTLFFLMPTFLFAHTPGTGEYIYVIAVLFGMALPIAFGALLIVVCYNLLRKRKTTKRNIRFTLLFGWFFGSATNLIVIGYQSLTSSTQIAILITTTALFSFIGAYLSTFKEREENTHKE